MLLDQFMPAWHFRERHHTLVAAEPEQVYQAVAALEMDRSPLVSLLLRLRELPWRLRRQGFRRPDQGNTLQNLLKVGFILLADQPPQEMVLGLVGRFWTPAPELRRLKPGEFARFSQPGLAKVATNLLVEPLGPGQCRLSTETRVLCLGRRAKRGFRCYWLVIRPFSGLIRREWLRLLRQDAEKAARRRGEA